MAFRCGLRSSLIAMDWLPTSVWAIEHQDGVIVVDTSQGAFWKPASPSALMFGGRLSSGLSMRKRCGPSELGRAM